MRTVNKASVFYQGVRVGTVAEMKDGRTAFQYDESWLRNGFSISPLSLPLQDRVFIAEREPFDGLFGVFDDCLPDGWGRLLVDRHLRSKGIEASAIGPVTRLSLISENGLGALEFQPCQYSGLQVGDGIDFDDLKLQCDCILKDSEPEDLDLLFHLGGSSGGARPKAHVQIGGESWIVKFPSSYDSENIGEMEYRYNLAAKACGVDVSESRLLESRICSGYFATRRFDRRAGEKIHMVSAGGLLEASHRYPSLDYSHIFKLSNILTHGTTEYERIFRLMCFNEYSHNRDDHSRNFSFLLQDGKWRLSPAYDLTYSNSLNGEHATTINGKGRTVSDSDIRSVGLLFLRSAKTVESIMEQVKSTVKSQLSEYLGK